MSSRMLKRLQGGPEKELESLRAAAEDDSDEEDMQNGSRLNTVHLNPFNLLNQSLSESEVKEDDNETEHTSTTANLCSVSKKKKRKRKKKTKYSGNHVSSEDNELTDKRFGNMDATMTGKGIEAGQQKLSTSRVQIDKSLLAVELKHLNPHNEMRRTFGKRVVKIENKRGRQKLTFKSTYLVTPKETWPPITKNMITMKSTSPPDPASTTALSYMDEGKVLWFAFEHSEYYQNIQNMFLSAMERTDSDFLINLIRRCPYHVDSTIQLSELCKLTEDYALASEFLERALLVLESALHPSFSLTAGNCRLDYRRQENRSFFIVLFKQAQYLEGRACCRTAFEISKLILNLNPEDPLAMILVLDYYALRSKQYTWLVKYYEEFNSVRNLSQLPNMAYSYALALFCVHGQCDESDQALQYALLMFPGVLRPLLDEMSVNTDQRVIASSYFNSEVSSSQSPALHQLVSLYVCRAKIVWRQCQYLPWLEANVNVVLDRVSQKDPVLEEYSYKRNARYGIPPRAILRHVILADFKEKVPLATFLAKEKSPVVAYDPLPPLDSINFYERKSSSSSPTTSTPNHSVSMFFQSLMPTFNLQYRVRYDIGNAVEAAAIEAAAFEAAAARDNLPGGGGGGVAAIDGADGEGAAAAAAAVEEQRFNDGVELVNRQLQALNANIGNANPDANAPNEERPENASYRELTQSIAGIVDILRDFVNNFHTVEPGQEAAAGDNNDTSEEDTTDYT